MNKIKRSLSIAAVLAAITILIGCAQNFNANSDDNIIVDVNWPEELSKNDLTWDRLPEKWEDAPFLGNGWMGTTVYRNIKWQKTGKKANPNYQRQLRLDVHHAGVQDHRSEGKNLFDWPRLPIGYFTIDTVGKLTDSRLRLDLWNAELYGTVKTEAGGFRLRTIVHTKDMLVWAKVEPFGKEKALNITFHPHKAISPRCFHRGFPDNYRLNPDPEIIEKANGIQLCRQRLLAGGEHATAWRISKDNGTVTLRFSVAHSFPELTAVDEAVKAVKNAEKKNLTNWINEHRKWWHDYYPKSFISFNDPYWQSFYRVQLYKMASATRADRCLADNQGPWLHSTPWPGIWWNLNVQLTYWPFWTSNHLEEGSSLANTITRCRQTLINNVPEPYRSDSAGIGHASSQTLERSVAKIGTGKEAGNLTWALHDVWLHYRHSMDDKFLEDDLLPILRRSINYYLHFLKEGDDGRYHLPPTASPEYPGTASDCNYDLSLLRWGCKTLLWIDNRLGLDDPLAAKWRDLLDNLTDYPGDKKRGYYIGADRPFIHSHRHFSHLLMIYPLYLVNIEQTGGRNMIEQSLETWHKKKAGLRGYSFTGAASIAAALGNGNLALQKLNGLKSCFDREKGGTAVTMYRESGPVIETPLSAAQSIHDMLIQSWGNTIRVFPAVPAAWPDVAIAGLRTQGAFEVSAMRKNGTTQWVMVKSLAGETFRIRPNITGELKIKSDGNIEEIDKGLYQLRLKKGQKALFARTDFTAEPLIQPVSSKPYHFGLN